MKVKLGPYIYRFTTHALEDLWYKTRYGKITRWEMEDEDMDKYDRWFEKVSDKIQDVLNATVNKIQDRRKRKQYVKIDYYDVWGADHTLALIILPTLKLLKEKKHGSPYVDPEDVPEELRPTEEAGPDNGYSDNTHHERWEWVLDEMIWAFEQIVDEDSEDQFFDHSESRQYESDNPDDVMGSISKVKIDMERLKAHNARVTRGTTLFGKYYRALWD